MAAERLRVAVLCGGASTEREVSLVTGKMVHEALSATRYDAWTIDVPELIPSLTGTHRRGRPDIVFVALHGVGGEDGTVQGALELCGMPYTGSGVMASAIAMDKVRCKRLLSTHGVPVIEGISFKLSEYPDLRSMADAAREQLGAGPLFVKPSAGGSTVGCTLASGPAGVEAALGEAFRHCAVALVEQYISGIEITVGVLEREHDLLALPAIEIVPRAEYYDYASKYAPGGSDHIIPARIPGDSAARAAELAIISHNALGCDGMSRSDFLLDSSGLFLLEVNTIPGMTPTSLLPQAAAHAGIPFSTLLTMLIEAALRRDASGRG